MGRIRKHNYISDNRGSSLVLALVTVSFIAVIGMTIVTMAISSYRIKAMEAKGKKAYYNADLALDEIYAKLGQNSYEALGAAYETVITQLLEVNKDSVIMIDNERANAMLKAAYFNSVVSFITAGDIDTILLGYLSDDLKPDFTSDYTLTVKAVPSVVGASPVVINSHLAADGVTSVIDYVTIENVTVEYQNVSTDYFSKVTTNLNVVFPENAEINIVRDTDEVLMSFRDYAIVSNKTIYSVKDVTVNGSIYGKDAIFVGKNQSGAVTEASSLTVNANAGTIVDNVVTMGNITAAGNSAATPARFSFNGDKIWADNIELVGAGFTMGSSSSAYIADDLTFMPSDIATISNTAVINGDYYGYSIEGYGVSADSATPAKSSAVIINSRNSTLDLSSVKTLVLGGYGWVLYDQSNNKAYRTGESIAVRYTQSAYILPSAWGGMINNNFFGRDLLDSSNPVIRYDIDATRKGYYYNFSSGDNAATFYKALYSNDVFTDLCNGILSHDASFDVAAASEIRLQIRAIMDEAYAAFLSGSGYDPSVVSINPDARVYEKGIIRKNGVAEVGDYSGVSDELVHMLYDNSVARSKVVGSLLIELGDDWIYDSSKWELGVGGSLLYYRLPISYDAGRFSYKMEDGDLSRGAVENILKGMGLIDKRYYYYTEAEDTHMNNSDYIALVTNEAVEAGGGIYRLSTLLSGITDKNGVPIRKGIIITTSDIVVDTDFTGCIISAGNISINGGTYTADAALVEKIMNDLPGLKGYFNNDAEIVKYGRHETYNTGEVAEQEDEEDPGDLNSYSASDCVTITDYHKN